MEKLFYDLHIHSCLSPCGNEDMTPNNIVNMACLKGLDLIALTDHNTCGNGAAVKAVAEKAGLMVLFGMEVETCEEVHILCLFAKWEEAISFEQAMQPYFLQVQNREDIYGEQWIMDEQDCVTGRENRLLVIATHLSFQRLFHLVKRLGGAFIPAHIDRQSYSVLSNMGFIPEELPIATVEVSPAGVKHGFLETHAQLLEPYQVITSSDAHYLWQIAERQHWLAVEERSEAAVIRCLKYGEKAI